MTSRPAQEKLYTTLLVVRGMLRRAQAEGVDVEEALRVSGLTRQVVDVPNGVVPLECAQRLFEYVQSRTQDPFLALHVSEDTGPHDAGLVGYNAIVRESAEEVLRMGVENLRRVSNLFECVLSLNDPVAFFRLVPNLPVERAAPWAEMFLLPCVLNIQRIIDPTFRALDVKLMHGPPEDDSEHRRLYQCPVRFAQPHYEVTFDPAIARSRSQSHNPGLLTAIAPYVELDYAASPLTPEAPARLAVRTEIRKLLNGETPTIEKVSEALEMKPRTLQHRLGQEGTSYREVLEEVRKDVALSAIRNRVDIAWLAQQLGYQETAAFYRAFRRWTGTTPAAFRAASESDSGSGRGQ